MFLSEEELKVADINTIVGYWLMSNWLYYCQNKNAISDQTYDYISKRIAEEFDLITHKYKHLVYKESFSGFNIPGHLYPYGIRQVALRWHEEVRCENGLFTC